MKSVFAGAALVALVGSLSTSGLVYAGTITSIATSSLPGFSTGTIGPIGLTPAPNNDNATAASPNTVLYSIFFNSAGPLQVEFVTSNSGGTTEYRFTQNFVNNSGEAWTGFVFELGYGLGSSFVPSSAVDGLDFDFPDVDPSPTASAFPALTHGMDRIEWSGGSVPSIGTVGFTFAIDVPDNLSLFNPNTASQFTLRQTPVVPTQTVPEPSSLLLFGAGLLTLIHLRRRR